MVDISPYQEKNCFLYGIMFLSMELKNLLMVRQESEKAGLKLNIQKLRSWHLVHHFIANRWGNNGNSDRLYFGGLQNHCGW